MSNPSSPTRSFLCHAYVETDERILASQARVNEACKAFIKAENDHKEIEALVARERLVKRQERPLTEAEWSLLCRLPYHATFTYPGTRTPEGIAEEDHDEMRSLGFVDFDDTVFCPGGTALFRLTADGKVKKLLHLALPEPPGGWAKVQAEHRLTAEQYALLASDAYEVLDTVLAPEWGVPFEDHSLLFARRFVEPFALPSAPGKVFFRATEAGKAKAHAFRAAQETW